MSNLRDRLEDLWRDIEGRQKKWENLIDKWGAAYESAYSSHLKHMPKQVAVPPASSMHAGFTKQLAGSALAVWFTPGAIPILMLPIGEAIDYLGTLARVQPSLGDLAMPASESSTPGTYHKFTNFSIRTACIRFQEALNKIIAASGQKAISLSEWDYRTTQEMLELSPFWHVPAGWDIWNHTEIAEEFERNLWAAWTKERISPALSSGKKFARLLAADFLPTLKRLNQLKEAVRGVTVRQYEALSIFQPQMLNGGVIRALAEWGRRYRPKKDTMGTLPKKVQVYLFQQGVRALKKTWLGA